MKAKYYLRGMGLGIIVTSLISMIFYREKLSKQQLIGLGMGIVTVILLNL